MKKNAAVLVKDVEAVDVLLSNALSLVNDEEQLQLLHKNILTLALPDSARHIASEVMKLAER